MDHRWEFPLPRDELPLSRGKLTVIFRWTHDVQTLWRM
jgi:hypothetical protein